MESGPGVAVADPTIRQKYIDERNKRVRPEGLKQFLKLADSAEFKYLDDDPWVDHDAFNRATPAIADGDDVKFLLVGAGFGGLLFAANLIKAGFKAADIRIVDIAGGFGGTWYWNRYPGLMCDVESYIYLPLLEEMGYMPKHRYAYGPEIRAYSEQIAQKWGFADKALFRASCRSAQWDDAAKRWTIDITENRGPKEPKKEIKVTAQYMFIATGTLNAPQIPVLPGFDKFKGQHFHTSRWNYDITGGSDVDWTLEKLKEKRVGIIGTGATAVQAIPQLAKWAKHLYVFQRTPSSVDVRGQRPTDPEEWKNITSTQGWHRTRGENFNSQISNAPIGENIINDGWSRISAYSGLIGSPGIVTPEKIPEHVAKLHACDFDRAENVRARTSEVVKDPATAEKLKHWYPSWCKRPAFHDEYLPAFNLRNVTLVDTDGKGVDGLTEDAVVVKGTSYPIDVLILSTGFALRVEGGSGSPAQGAGVKVIGRDGLDMDQQWLKEGAETLHGVTSHGFPNLFWPGPLQAGVTANFTFTLAMLSSHIAQILAEGERRVGSSGKATVEATKAAQDAWGFEVLMRAASLAGMSGCTPSYLNSEGVLDKITDPQAQMKMARGSIWGEGIASYQDVLKAWHDEGELKGFEIKGNV
ncbi:Phenylacetone monooxygenase [Favolaschia claudopus]|uniref:Phenylacetone monooxygenase n=1 Tax=Favolaschia claudopus TaxID=2862362 RepID=A0AAW0DB58_9AGAR